MQLPKKWNCHFKVKQLVIASDEVSPNEIAHVLGEAFGNQSLQWISVPEEQMLKGILEMGMNEWITNGFIKMQAAQRDGSLYEDFYKYKPTLGKVKLPEFAKQFAEAYNN